MPNPWKVYTKIIEAAQSWPSNRLDITQIPSSGSNVGLKMVKLAEHPLFAREISRKFKLLKLYVETMTETNKSFEYLYGKGHCYEQRMNDNIIYILGFCTKRKQLQWLINIHNGIFFKKYIISPTFNYVMNTDCDHEILSHHYLKFVMLLTCSDDKLSELITTKFQNGSKYLEKSAKWVKANNGDIPYSKRFFPRHYRIKFMMTGRESFTEIKCGNKKCRHIKSPFDYHTKWYICKKCKKIYYCSRKCQKYDWNRYDHKSYCRQLRKCNIKKCLF